MKQKYSDLLEDMNEYAYDIANWRVDHIKSRMEKAPDDYPEFAAASKALDEEKERLIQKLGGDFRELEPLTRAFLMYQSILICEVYTQAVMDGGRVLHAPREPSRVGRLGRGRRVSERALVCARPGAGHGRLGGRAGRRGFAAGFSPGATLVSLAFGKKAS